MRYVRILFLHLENIFEYKSVSFVWFLVTLINPLIYLIFWWGSFVGSAHPPTAISLSSITSYYFLMVIFAALVQSHVEENVANDDILLGGLSIYLMKPFSYFWLKFYHELPYRIMQGTFAVIVFLLFHLFLGKFISITGSLSIWIWGIAIAILAYFLSFIFKMVIGISALWFTDFFGLSQLIDAIILIFSGMVVPLGLFPELLKTIATKLPFAYIIYYPVLVFQGNLDQAEMARILFIQLMWFVLLYCLYQILWHKGIRKYTGIGQ